MFVQHTVSALADLVPLLPQDVPNPGGGTAPPGSEKFITIMGWFKWGALGMCVLALIAAGAMLGWGRGHGDGGEHASRIGRVLLGVAIVAGAFSLVSFLAQ